MSTETTSPKKKENALESVQRKLRENREKERHKKVRAGEAPFVDLTPKLYREERLETTLKASWKRIFILIVVVTLGAIAAAVGWRYLAFMEYEEQSAQEVEVEDQVQEYSEVNSLLNEVESLESSITNSMSSEVDWTPVLVDVENSLPSTTSIQTITIDTGGNMNAEVIASVRMTLTSTDPLDYANVADSLPYAVNTNLGNLTSGNGVYNFTIAFGLDESVLAYNFVDPPGSEFLGEDGEFSFEDFQEMQDMDPDFDDEFATPEGDF